MSRKTDAHTLIVLFVLALVAAFCTLSLPAHATGKPDPAPSSPSTSAADAAARAKAGAKAASKSTSSIGDVSQGLTTGDDRSRFLSLAFAPPVATPQLPPIAGCAARVTQSARSAWLLIGGGSTADALIDPTDCTLIEIRNSMAEACQYASAKQIDDRLAAKLLPGYVANSAVVFKDLAPEVCAELKKPPRAENLVATAPVPAASAPEASRSSAASATESCATAAPEAAKPARQAGQRRAGPAAAAARAASAPAGSTRCVP